jgi:hypothetical protein
MKPEAAVAKNLPYLTWGATKELPGYIKALHSSVLPPPATVTTTNGVKIMTDGRGRSSIVPPEIPPPSITNIDGTKVLNYGKGQTRFVPPPPQPLGMTNMGGVPVITGTKGEPHIVPQSAMPPGTNALGPVQTQEVLDRSGKPMTNFFGVPAAGGRSTVKQIPRPQRTTDREERIKIKDVLKQIEANITAAENDMGDYRERIKKKDKGAQALYDEAKSRWDALKTKRAKFQALQEESVKLSEAPAIAPDATVAPTHVPVKVPMDRPAKKEELIVGGLYKTHLGPRFWDGGYFVTNAPALKQ